MTKTARIAVVGSANVDLTTFTDQFPRPGETIFGDSFDLGFGGKGANQAVAARLCGAEVQMIAKLGNDIFGAATVENFKSLGIDASRVEIVDGVSSGVAPIFVDSRGQNRIIVVKGANDELRPGDVDRAADDLRRADCIVLQFEIPMETIYYTIQFARKNNIRCIVNPAPGMPADLETISQADYFIPNESEAETITKMPVTNVEEARNCARFLLDQGLRRVVITLGEKGALLGTPEETKLIPAFQVSTKDSTGAGDACIGSFAAFLGEGIEEAEALSRACLYAGLSTADIGTQKSFSTRADFETEWRSRT